MSAASFEEEIRNGVITLPADIRSRFHGRVHVVVWNEEEAAAASEEKDLLDDLIENPLPNFTPLSREEIYEGR